MLNAGLGLYFASLDVQGFIQAYFWGRLPQTLEENGLSPRTCCQVYYGSIKNPVIAVIR